MVKSVWRVICFGLIVTGCSEVTAALIPNIVVMLADDMGWGDTSAYQDLTGNSDVDQIHTPQMERLARMGVRFSDAHTPSSRCTPTRYGLLTGRYPWRNRLKHFVLFGAQGDPMIERDRPTIATLLKDQGYATGMVGKWHVGLRYRRSDGQPADAWDDADLTQPMFDTPLDHGFDECWFTSRSHGSAGPKPHSPRNSPLQSVGPGHIHGRQVIGATGHGKELANDGPEAYVLKDLGGRHSEHAIEFLNQYSQSATQPFFLYYASNSNHTPYTPDDEIDHVEVASAGRSVAGQSVKVREDFIYENDVALGRLLDYFVQHDDPRNPGHKLIENTLVIFTSDNGADVPNKSATGPWRSNKGSVYEGGHRVPFIAACPALGIGDGDDRTPGSTNHSLICLTDLYATFAEMTGQEMPDWRTGERGGEDSTSILAALKGEQLPARCLIFNDHKEGSDPAASVLRCDNPVVEGSVIKGNWKLFFDDRLLRTGEIHPVELYDLATDPQEKQDRLDDVKLSKLVEVLRQTAEEHRNSGGHRLAEMASDQRIRFEWATNHDARRDANVVTIPLAQRFSGGSHESITVETEDGLQVTFQTRSSVEKAAHRFDCNPRGLGITGGMFGQFDTGESMVVTFNRDVIVESAAIVAGNGQCGGFYQVGNQSPLAIYCIDADIDSQDQSGILSDIGIVKKGDSLRFDSSPHFGVEALGQWRIAALTIRLLKNN